LKERERREKMADLIDELRVLIPNCGDNGKKLNQSNVMSYAVEYIRSLHAQVVELKQEILFLKGMLRFVLFWLFSFSSLFAILKCIYLLSFVEYFVCMEVSSC
jgi:hypothetical protein